MSELVASAPPRVSLRQRTIDLLPRGNTLSDAEWTRRHRLLLTVLGLHVPLLVLVGVVSGWSWGWISAFAGWTALLTLIGALLHRRRMASLVVTLGLTSCSIGLVVLSNGSIEAHFHFFIIVGFLALYQDWFPFLWNIAFTVLSHGIGSALGPNLIFNHQAGQGAPWVWSLVHGVSVLAACAGVLVFWRFTEDLQDQKSQLARQLAESEISKKEFTSDLLLNLARRNQSMFHRQLDIINDLEEKERDPDVLAELFRLDHLATRVRRNAESLLVLSGEQTPRVWSAPVPLRDVVRAAIAETEDLDRITFTVEEGLSVLGSSVADLTHLLAELIENAVRYSPPTSAVTVTNRPYHPSPGAHLLVVEDTGVGMPAEEVARANELLARPQEVDVSASRQLGFHVVSRLAERHGIKTTLTPTPGCGLTAVLVLPPELFQTGSTRVLTPSKLIRPEGVASQHPMTLAASTGSAPLGPSPLDGRHTWPGAGASGGFRAESAEDHNGAHEARVADARTAGVDRPDGAGRSGGLIHPIVVPPPQGFGGDGAALSADTPGPRVSPEGHHRGRAVLASRAASDTDRESHDADSEQRRDAEGASGQRRSLSRRVPQSHLAPELARPLTEDTPALASGLGSGTGASGVRPVEPRPVPSHVSPAETPTLDSGGALSALSRYQASRRMAHHEIDSGLAVDRSDDTRENGAWA